MSKKDSEADKKKKKKHMGFRRYLTVKLFGSNQKPKGTSSDVVSPKTSQESTTSEEQVKKILEENDEFTKSQIHSMLTQLDVILSVSKQETNEQKDEIKEMRERLDKLQESNFEMKKEIEQLQEEKEQLLCRIDLMQTCGQIKNEAKSDSLDSKDNTSAQICNNINDINQSNENVDTRYKALIKSLHAQLDDESRMYSIELKNSCQKYSKERDKLIETILAKDEVNLRLRKQLLDLRRNKIASMNSNVRIVETQYKELMAKVLNQLNDMSIHMSEILKQNGGKDSSCLIGNLQTIKINHQLELEIQRLVQMINNLQSKVIFLEVDNDLMNKELQQTRSLFNQLRTNNNNRDYVGQETNGRESNGYCMETVPYVKSKWSIEKCMPLDVSETLQKIKMDEFVNKGENNPSDSCLHSSFLNFHNQLSYDTKKSLEYLPPFSMTQASINPFASNNVIREFETSAILQDTNPF